MSVAQVPHQQRKERDLTGLESASLQAMVCNTRLPGTDSDLAGLESASLQAMVCNGRLPGTDRPKSSSWIFCLFIYFRTAHRHSWLHLPSQSLIATQAAGFLALSANALPLAVCCAVALLVIQKRNYHGARPEGRKHKSLLRLSQNEETGPHGFPFARCLLRGKESQ